MSYQDASGKSGIIGNGYTKANMDLDRDTLAITSHSLPGHN